MSGWYRRRYQQMEGDLKHPSSFQGANDNNPLLHRTGFGGSDTGGSAGEGRAQAIIKGGVYEALIEFYGFLRGGAQGGGGGIVPASFGGGAGAAAGGGVPGAGGGRGWGGGGYTALPNGSDVGPGTGQGAGATPAGPPGGGVGPLTGPQADVLAGGRRPMESGGGAAGITAPAGTPIQRAGMATVTTSGGRKFQVDARFAQNFQGFLTDYEKAGGVIGPESGTLGHRPHNASGHPIGAAIDVNQVGYGVRGRGGKTLSVETENELAAKWGLVSGANWRRPDTGHFGIRSPEAAREALIKQGLNPPPYGSAVGPGTGKGAGESPPDQSAKTVRGSWFGNAPGWHDPSEPPGSPKSNRPGIALPDKSTIGQMFEVTTPDGRKFTLPQTDYGPAKRTGRGIDITASAASQMGYTSKDFPTDGGFSYRRLDDRAALDRPALDRSALSRPTEINSTGQLNVDVKAPAGTKVDYSGDNLLRNTSMQRQTQMMPTDTGPSVSDTARSYMRGGS